MASNGVSVEQDYARQMDAQDPLKHLRSEFIIPTRADLKSKTLKHLSSSNADDDKLCTYLCGNSLGLQPRRTTDRIATYLQTWATKGVLGHFFQYEDSPLAPFLPLDEQAAQMMAPLLGASQEEVAIMETLTANLHLMMASFYRPTQEKHKIIVEDKAFPSDHYAVESQIIHHGFDPKDSMILIRPDEPHTYNMSTQHILETMDEHAESTAMVLLPGVQYFSGQLLDIKAITTYAHSRDILIGWDLAHAVGNVPLSLHEWDVDFAVWCNYKYVNSGPGAIAGLFVNSRHGQVDLQAVKTGKSGFRDRLCGWWGGDKSIRFDMANHYIPIPGAQGFQVGNASALAVTALIASLEVFGLTDMHALRQKSIQMTGYLQDILLTSLPERFEGSPPYQIITPLNPQERGAQLSVKLLPGMLPIVMEILEDNAVILDERKPDVIRIAPAPLYNTFQDVRDFGEIFRTACQRAQARLREPGETTKPASDAPHEGNGQAK